jgi:ribosomal protein S18 acetylase RimI-like enzyme
VAGVHVEASVRGIVCVSACPLSAIIHPSHPPPPPLHSLQAFFPNSGIFAPVLRLDRVVGLQVGYGNAKESESKSAVRGPFLCLVAAVEAEPPRPADPAPWWMPAAAWPAFSPDVAAAAGIAGAAVVDLQGGHVPPRTARARGTVRLAPRKGLAYVSNLAVAPSARRSGLGTALLAAAEAQAWDWGAHALALHVDARNEGAAGLYRRAGFRMVEPLPRPGMSGLGGLTGPSGQPLALMLKVRPRRGQGVGLSPPPSTGVEESGGS